MLGVELAQQVELQPLGLRRLVIVADVLDELLDARVLGIDVSPLVHARKESGLPVLSLLDGVPTRTHRDEAREVLVLGAEPVGDP